MKEGMKEVVVSDARVIATVQYDNARATLSDRPMALRHTWIENRTREIAKNGASEAEVDQLIVALSWR